MQGRGIIFIIALILGFIGVFLIYSIYQTQKKFIERLVSEGRAVQVIVATKNIPKNTQITQDMISLEAREKKSLPDDFLTNAATVIGNIAEADIVRGEVIRKKYIGIVKSYGRLSDNISMGKVAYTIPVDKISSVNSLIIPGDFVDIITSTPIPVGKGQTDTVVASILEMKKVLAVNDNTSPYARVHNIQTITLEVSPDEARMLTYALERSTVRLVLRQKLDTSQSIRIQPFTGGDFIQRLGFYQPQIEQKEEPKVDVFSGKTYEQRTVKEK